MPADINHQSSSISSQSSRKVNKDPLCKPVTDAFDYFFNETVFGGSLAAEFGALFNFLFGHVMFWAVGLPTMLDYGFEETRNGDNGVCLVLACSLDCSLQRLALSPAWRGLSQKL